MNGGDWNFWMRADFRGKGNRKIMHFAVESRALALDRFPVVVSMTKYPELVPKIELLGYKYVGVVPRMAEGADCHILYVTRAMAQPLDEERWTD